MTTIASVWEAASGDKNDTLVALNGNNSVQELMTAAAYNVRAAWTSHEGGDVAYDQLTAQKVLACAYTNPNSVSSQRGFNNLDKAYQDKQISHGPGALAKQGLFEVGTVTGTPQKSLVDGNEVVVTGVKYSDGSTDTATLTTIKGVDYKNNPTYFVTVDFSNN